MDNVRIIEQAGDSAIAAWIADRLNAALSSTGGAVAFTMPGGTTPFPILDIIARETIDWSRIAVWPGDDRVVAEDHPASNTGKIRALLEPLGAQVMELDVAAKVPSFAFTWLGMGADGHIASLFPNTDPRADDRLPIRRLTPDPLPPEAPFDRITLTIPSLLNTGALLFVIRGEEKRAVFEAAMRGDNDLPIARLLSATTLPVTCFT